MVGTRDCRINPKTSGGIMSGRKAPHGADPLPALPLNGRLVAKIGGERYNKNAIYFTFL